MNANQTKTVHSSGVELQTVWRAGTGQHKLHRPTYICPVITMPTNIWLNRTA